MDVETRKVLLIGNNPDSLKYVRDLLLQSDTNLFIITDVSDFELARKSISSSWYDLYFVHHEFSNNGGIDLLCQSQATSCYKPIFFVADHEDFELDIQAMGVGAVDFLVLDHLNLRSLERSVRHADARKCSELSLKRAEQHSSRLAAIVASSEYAMMGGGFDGTIQSWNKGAENLFGYTASEVIGKPFEILLPPDRHGEVIELLERVSRGERIEAFETVRRAKSGALVDIALSISPMRDSNGRLIGQAGIARDLRQLKVHEARIQQQMLRIQALRNIDMAITSSLDLRVTLNVLLDQVTTHLKADCASILLLNNYTHRLEFATGRGFRSTPRRRVSIRMGEGPAGRAALERRVICIKDLNEDDSTCGLLEQASDEGFVCYWAAPLITKGRVEGVLEVYHRSDLDGDSDWVSFLETLAGQAAIAIENADLCTDLQKSNTELHLAYDSTLEGWSKALDLRDRETEGHTQRVTERAVALARLLGVNDSELAQIRRGALLHDIGKMGIPDAILLKPGQLTEDEWLIMKRHPSYAYELLSPISYLKSALDIPYCHHEKWDGTGYPRGLAGAQIPLSARIFAVVDVWDALRSDRPYRPAWTIGDVREYIWKKSGTHFDPSIVEIFLNSDLPDVD